jgi:hypothetical protein
MRNIVEESTCIGVDARHKPLMMMKRKRRRKRKRKERRRGGLDTRVYIYTIYYLSSEFLYGLSICVQFYWKFIFF